MKMRFALLLATLLPLCSCGGNAEDTYKELPNLNKDEKVNLKIAINYEIDKGIDYVVSQFTNRYPNVSVTIQYIENYDTNAFKLLKSNNCDIVFSHDLFYSESTTALDDGSEVTTSTDDYYYNFLSDENLDIFSKTTSKINANYKHTRTTEEGDVDYIYSAVLGAEQRGLFVNKTLLEKVYKLDIPTTWDEFISCCKTIKDSGYRPIDGPAGSSGVTTFLADAVNEVVHNSTYLKKMKNAEEGVSTLFSSTFDKIQQVTTNRYYDYKEMEDEGKFKNSALSALANDFLGITRDSETYEYYAPENNIGYVAFLPYLSSLESAISKRISDLKLDTEFVFIPTPNSENGKSSMYLTPYLGYVLNKQSANLQWLKEFVNFTFNYKDVSIVYAEKNGVIPNTSKIVDYIEKKYSVSVDESVAFSGDILFSTTYNGYTPLAAAILNASKNNAPKYMVLLRKDEQGNIDYYTDENGEYLLTNNGASSTKVYKDYIGEEDPTHPGLAFTTPSYFVNQLESNFAKYRG